MALSIRRLDTISTEIVIWENGKVYQQTMGIEDENFATLIGSVSPEIRKKNFEKQKALREEHRTRISIKSKGIKAFLKDKGDKIKSILKIGSDQ